MPDSRERCLVLSEINHNIKLGMFSILSLNLLLTGLDSIALNAEHSMVTWLTETRAGQAKRPRLCASNRHLTADADP